MIRAFLGIPIVKEERAYLQRDVKPITEQLGNKIHWIEPKKWHVTVRFLGNVDNDMLIGISQAALQCVQSIDGFSIIVNKISGFPSPSSKIVAAHIMPDERLHFMFKTLDDAAQAAGIKPEPKSFKPHITLAKFQSESAPFDPVLLSNFLLSAEELVLYESRPCGKSGNRYIVLQKFPFAKA